MIQKNKTKELLNHMQKLGEQMESNTTQTKSQLYKQGEQLSRIYSKSQELDIQTDKTQKLSRQIYSFWYYLKDKVTGQKKSEQPTQTNNSQPNKSNIKGTNPQNKAEKKLYSEQLPEKQKTEDEALQSLAQKMLLIKKGQKQISEEIDKQSIMVGKITDKTDKINGKIQYSNKLLKKKL